MDTETALLLGAIAIGGYAVYRFSNATEKTIQDAGAGFVSAAGTTADAYSDLASTTNVVKSLSQLGTDFVDAVDQKLFGGNYATSKPLYTPEVAKQNAEQRNLIQSNLFINPTAQSIMPTDMSVWVPPNTVQNTVGLAKSSPTTKASITNIGKSVPKTQSIAFKKGYI